MNDLITKEEAAYRLDMPIFMFDQLIERGDIRVHSSGGEQFFDPFELSRLPGYSNGGGCFSQTMALLNA